MSASIKQISPGLLHQIRDSVDAGWQLPAAFYCDDDIFAAEQEFLSRSWSYVGRESDLAEPGAWFTATIKDVPVVVVRRSDGDLAAYVNVCRHRQHPVALGERGCDKQFQCRYHGWTYTTDGDLRGAPGMENDPDFRRSELSLVGVRVQSRMGLVFVATDAEAEDFEVFLGDAAKRAAELDVPSDQSILETVRGHGIAVRSSCEEGICGSCETRVISGDVEHRDSILTDQEREQSQTMMICTSRCRSERLVLDL